MLTRATLLFLCFASAAGLVAHASHTEARPIRESFDRLPMQLDDWRGTSEAPLDPQVLGILGVDDYVTRAYRTSDRADVDLYIGYYQSQRQGDTIHSPLNCLPGAGWAPLSKRYLTIPVSSAAGAAQDISVNRYVIQKGLDRQLVLYWYQSHGRIVANEYWNKLYLLEDAVRLNRTDAALVRVIAPIAPDVNDAEERAEVAATRFVQTLFPHLSHYLPS